jgi:hypothetical protein
MTFFCRGENGIRVGYGSPRALRSLPEEKRRRYRGRVILILTASRLYSVRGLRPGTQLAKARRRLNLGPPFRVGANVWYLVRDGRVAGVLKVRRGVIDEVGIADKSLVSTHRAAGRFLRSFS